MLSVLSNRTYRDLFAAQVVALVGTGLATVALGLLAWDLAGGDAGLVLGTALAIKMVAYVTLSPVAQAFADRVPRRTLLVVLNLIRAGVALALWPRPDSVEIARTHDNLPAGHPHIAAGARHSHAYVIDELHPRWPSDGEIARGV